jgi:hypothetical protein
VFEKHKSPSPKAIPTLFTHKLFRRAKMRIYRAGFTQDGQKIKAKRWYMDFYFEGQRCRLPGLENRRATESLAAKIEELCDLRTARQTPGGGNCSYGLTACPKKS